MSHKATNWAFDQPKIYNDPNHVCGCMKPSEALVLLALADRHNIDNGCFPRIDTVAFDTNMTVRSVQTQLSKLKKRGLLYWDARFADGKRISNRYHMKFEADFDPKKLSEIISDRSITTGKKEHLQPENSDNYNRKILPTNPVIEPVNRTSSSSSIDILDRSKEEDEELKSFEEKGSDYWDQQFLELVKSHPGAAHLPTAKWKVAFFELDEENRKQAVECHSAWVRLLQQKGRKFFPSLREYFEDRLFEGIKSIKEVKPQIAMKPYDRNWIAHRIWLLAQGATGNFVPNAFQQKMIDSGRENVVREDKLKAQYPDIKALDQSAFNGDTYHLPDGGQRVMGTPTKVQRGSSEWDDWKAFHHKMGWPWIEAPKAYQFIIFPIALDELDHTKSINQITARRKA